MDHIESVKTMAAERYLLRELSNEEIDAFEDHYFDCTECSQAVIDGTLLHDGGRSLVRQDRRPRQPGVLRWMPLAAAGLFGAVALYTAPMAMRVPALTAQVNSYAAAATDTSALSRVSDLPSVIFSKGRKQSTEETTLKAGRKYSYTPEMFADKNVSYRGFQVELKDAHGISKGGRLYSPQQANEPDPLILGPLQRGRYSLSIIKLSSDGNRTLINDYPFVVQ